ncbi:hypothetical protein L910_2991 [Vibrio fluvialis PG41]|uniref:Uncharacterized protein n=1 Tax=Vibrio fluvialis PG41 TaxID=1336752 RepID=S7I7N0_VIBFL|nr:hypothetical protein L910_2991 [Vibrio fluvialis PG41]
MVLVNFLSCLYGSELGVFLSFAALLFLSCLYGSEHQYSLGVTSR